MSVAYSHLKTVRAVQSLLPWLLQWCLISYYFYIWHKFPIQPKVKPSDSFQLCLLPVCSTVISNTKPIIFLLHGKQSDPRQCLKKSRLLTIFMEVWREENTCVHTVQLGQEDHLFNELWNYSPVSAVKFWSSHRRQWILFFFLIFPWFWYRFANFA